MKNAKSSIGKVKMALLAAAAMISVPVAGMAATTTITATAKLLGALTLTPTGMNFGNITFTGAPGAGDSVVLKTDGTATYTGLFANGGGTKAAGNLDVTGSSGNNISIWCDSSTTLDNGSGVTIALNAVKVSTLAGAAGGGAACNGLGGGAAVAAFTLTAGPDKFRFGATIDATTVTGGPIVAGTYTTAAAPINVTVLYD